jgi:uncharacterized membrane protein
VTGGTRSTRGTPYICQYSPYHVCALRRYILQVLSDLAAKQNITDISDDHIVAWANEKVSSALMVVLLYILLRACWVLLFAAMMSIRSSAEYALDLTSFPCQGSLLLFYNRIYLS